MGVTVDNGSLSDYIAKTSTIDGEAVQHVRLEQNFSVRYDEGATYTYIGEAEPGASTASAVWRVKRLTNANNTILWADGDTSFDNIWDNRASLSYS